MLDGGLALSLSESIMETCNAVLTFESVDKILWCDHSNETSSAVLLHGAICFSIFCKMKFGMIFGFLFFGTIVVQFCFWFNLDFPLFISMLIYDNEYQTKENPI